LVGCGSASNGAATVSTLQIWYATDDPIERAWAEQLAHRFARAHPGIRIDFKVYGFDDFNTKMQLALSSGHPPDLAYATPRAPGIPIYVRANELTDLSRYARHYHWAQRLRPGLLAEYNAPFALWAQGRVRTERGAGPIYAVPQAVAAVAVLYNRRLLAQLHVGVPHTLEEFVHAVVLAKRAGMIPLGLGNADGWLGDDWYLTLANTQFPPGYLESELRLSPRFSFQRAGFYWASSLLARWAQAGDFTPDFGGLDAQDGIDAFFRGHTLFQLISSTEDAQILSDQRATGVPIGLFPFPGRDEGSQPVIPYSGYEGWIVPRRSGNIRLAVTFITWVLQPATTRFLLQHGVLPAATVRASQVSPQRAALQRAYLEALERARPGVYLDAAPIPNLNATMEVNIQMLLAGLKLPRAVVQSIDRLYHLLGHSSSAVRIDGEF
jgi:raffinose/stachyose/melibiose transport system substrate-binding protein